MDFSTFLESLQQNINFTAFDYEEAEDWERDLAKVHSCDKYMIDIWADANALVSKHQAGADKESLKQLLEMFHYRCGLLYQIYDNIEDLAYECKINEWILDDYISGNNEFNMTADNVMKWFDKFYSQRTAQILA